MCAIYILPFLQTSETFTWFIIIHLSCNCSFRLSQRRCHYYYFLKLSFHSTTTKCRKLPSSFPLIIRFVFQTLCGDCEFALCFFFCSLTNNLFKLPKCRTTIHLRCGVWMFARIMRLLLGHKHSEREGVRESLGKSKFKANLGNVVPERIWIVARKKDHFHETLFSNETMLEF